MAEEAEKVPHAGAEARSYRCPVCGHVDATSMGDEPAVVRCSHCQTRLEVRPREGPSLSASARVAPPDEGGPSSRTSRSEGSG